MTYYWNETPFASIADVKGALADHCALALEESEILASNGTIYDVKVVIELVRR